MSDAALVLAPPDPITSDEVPRDDGETAAPRVALPAQDDDPDQNGLGMRLQEDAVAWADQRHTWPVGQCQRFVRTAQDCPPGAGTAYQAWLEAGEGHRHSGHYPPPGVNVCWYGGPGDPGHTALSKGNGIVRSTDWPAPGMVSDVSIGALTREWFSRPGMRYLGWTDRDNGQRTWVPPTRFIHGDDLRHALARRGVNLRNGRVFKTELAHVVGRGGMVLSTDKIGPATRRRARALETGWQGVNANGILSDADIRRLGFVRNAFQVT